MLSWLRIENRNNLAASFHRAFIQPPSSHLGRIRHTLVSQRHVCFHTSKPFLTDRPTTRTKGTIITTATATATTSTTARSFFPNIAKMQSEKLVHTLVANRASTSKTSLAATTPILEPPKFHRLADSIFVSRPRDRASPIAVSETFHPLKPLDPLLAKTPRFVVIFGWMDASLRLVSKYATPYTILFPHSTILIKLSEGRSYLTSEAQRRQVLETLVAEITPKDDSKGQLESEIQSDAQLELEKEIQNGITDSTVTLIEAPNSPPPSGASEKATAVSSNQQDGIVIHSFSDGGAGNLSLFLSLLSQIKSAQPDSPLPRIHSLIMDSSPGRSNPRTGSYAFTVPLSNRPALRAIARIFFYLILWAIKMWTKLKGDLSNSEKMRRFLNSLRAWDWIVSSASSSPSSSSPSSLPAAQEANQRLPPRMYLYTRADTLINWKYVEQHANELAVLRDPTSQPRLVEMEPTWPTTTTTSATTSSRRNQLSDLDGTKMSVELRRWEHAPHCGIGRYDFEGYWNAVVQFYQGVL